MMKHPHAQLIALFLALLLAGPAAANSADVEAAAPARTPDASGISTGSIDSDNRRSKERRFEDCMNAWDKGTHMSKRQWSRTCRTSMQEFPQL